MLVKFVFDTWKMRRPLTNPKRVSKLHLAFRGKKKTKASSSSPVGPYVNFSPILLILDLSGLTLVLSESNQIMSSFFRY